MKHRFLAILLATATPVAAQQLPTLFTGATTVPAGGAVYFNLECTNANGIQVSSFVLNFADPSGTPGTVDIYVAQTGTPTSSTWTPLVTGVNVTSVGPGAPTNVPLGTSSPLQLSDGCSFDVAIVSSLQHLVTDGSGGTLLYSNADLQMLNGSYSATPFAAPAVDQQVVNGVIFYQPGGTCPLQASATAVGDGCVTRFDSAYELFATGTLDLSIATFNGMIGVGGSIFPLPLQFSQFFQQPSPSSAIHSAVLSLADDGQTTLGAYGFLPPFDSIVVGSNGWVALGPGNSDDYYPSTAALRDNPSAAYYAWKDLDPSAGGVVWVEQRTAPNLPLPQLVVTFDGVPSYGLADSNTFQFVLTFASFFPKPFNAAIHFPAISPTGTPLLVGVSDGGPSEDPGSSDLSVAQSYAGDDVLPLTLAAVGRPLQGATPQPFELVTSNIPASALVHVGILGFSSGSSPLDGLGMPTCSLYQSLDFLISPTVVTGSSQTWTAFDIPPALPSLANVDFYVQSFVLGTDVNEAFGGIGGLTSNGVRCTIGTL